MTTSHLLNLIILVLVLFVLWRLFRPVKSEFNSALGKYERLKWVLQSSSEDPRQIVELAVDVIRTLQMVIRSEPKNGDAYVVLANVYYSLGRRFAMNGLFTLCYRYAGAVMHYWKANPTYTRNHSQGEYLWMLIEKDLQAIRNGEVIITKKQQEQLAAISDGSYHTALEQALDLDTLTQIKQVADLWFLLELVTHLNSQGKSIEALDICNAIIEKGGEIGPAFFARAQVLSTLGRYEGVIKDLETFEQMEGANEYSIATRLQAQRLIKP